MIDAIDSYFGGSNPGLMGSFLGRSREKEMADRAEAIQKGRSVSEGQNLESKVRGVAEDFVSVFMNQIMKSMRATVQENPEMHGDNGEKFFQEMLDTEQSKALAKGSGYGLTDLIYESLMTSYRMQEQSAASGVRPDAAGATDQTASADTLAEKSEPELIVEAIG